MQITDMLQYLVHTYANKIRTKTIVSDGKYCHNYGRVSQYTLNELLELVPSMPAINVSEADMVLADGEQWKSDVE